MASKSSDIVARLALNAEAFSVENARAFGEMEKRAADAAGRVKTTFDNSFAEVQAMAKRALALPRTETGALNLDSASIKAAATAASDQAVALREIAAAARQAAVATGDTTEQTHLYIQAANAAAIEAEQQARDLSLQALSLDRLQTELGRTSVAMARHDAAAQQATASAGAHRAGMQQLSFQLQDLGVQFVSAAGSGNVMKGVITGLAMQGPQIVSAVDMMRTSTGGLMTFLAGPWGAAIMTATSLLAILGTEFLSAGDEADEASGKMDKHRSVVDRLNSSYGDLLTSMNRYNAKSVEVLGNAAVNLERQRGQLRTAEGELTAAEKRLGASVAVDPKRQGSAPLQRDVAEAKARVQALRQEIETGAKVVELGTARIAEARRRAQAEPEKKTSKGAARPRSTINQEEREALRLEKQLLDAKAEAQGNVGKLAEEAIQRQQEWGKDQVTLGETMIQQDKDRAALREAELDGARQLLDYYLQQLDVIQRMGGPIGTVAGIVAGISDGGKFVGMRGAVGQLLNVLGPDLGNEGWKAITDKLDQIFGGQSGDGSFVSSMRDVLQAAAVGSAGASIIMGGKQNSLLSGLGGIAGKELLGKTLENGLSDVLGNKLGSALGGPLGSVIGGVAGSLIGGMFAKPKYGTAAISMNQYGELTANVTSGRGSAQKGAAKGAAGNVIRGIENIADTLDADITGAPNITIGTYKDKYRVSTTGYTGKLNFNGQSAVGLYDFGKNGAEDAIAFAIQKSIEGAVITGISQASINILKSGQDLQKALDKAVLIESVPKELQRRLDPVGYAIDELNKRFEKIVEALREGGATAEQMADAQKLYNMELTEAKEGAGEASQALKDFLQSMNAGGSSPLSLRDQENNARAVLDPYLGQIARGESIDQDKYLSAAQTFLEIERQLYGSTSKYFEAFDMIQGVTGNAIATIDNVAPIRTTADPFIQETAMAAKSTAASNENILTVLQQISAKLDQNATTSLAAFIGTNRGFAA